MSSFSPAVLFLPFEWCEENRGRKGKVYLIEGSAMVYLNNRERERLLSSHTRVFRQDGSQDMNSTASDKHNAVFAVFQAEIQMNPQTKGHGNAGQICKM